MDEKTRKKSWQEKRNALYVVLIVILVVLLSAVIVILKLRKIYGENICLSADCVNSSEFFLDIINNAIEPCQDFYKFACGGYAGQTSTLEDAQKRVNDEIKLLTSGEIHKYDSRSIKTQKKYFGACMNNLALDEDDNKSLKKLFETLGGWPLLSYVWINNYNLEKLTEKCVELGLFYDWFVDIDVTLGDNPKLRISPPRNIEYVEGFKENYQLLIENIAKLLRSNNSLDVISDSASSIVEFEKSLYQIVLESDEDYRDMKVHILRSTFPSLPWDALLKNVILKQNATIEVATTYLRRLERFIEKSSTRMKTNYIFWKITQASYQFLSSDIRREFEAYDDIIDRNANQSRFDFCYAITQRVFAYVSEAEYARKYASEKDSINIIFKNIKSVLRGHINETRWMNHTHKIHALAKLQNVTIYIGGPNEVFDQRKFDQLLGVDEIDILNLNNTLDIVRAVDKSRDKYNLNLRRRQISYLQARLYQGIMNIQATEYLPPDNLIYFPAAIIGGVYDNQKGLNFRNYSVLGTIIAHEIAHAFGILDSYILNNGSTEIKWSNSTFLAFQNETECIFEECLGYNGTEMPIPVTCQNTFDENFADYASVNIAYEAFKRIKEEEINQLPGLNYTSNQLFWISYAATMCDSLKHKTTGAHLLSHVEPAQRILRSYRNSPHFAKDFNCPEQSYMNPVDKCIVL